MREIQRSMSPARLLLFEDQYIGCKNPPGRPGFDSFSDFLDLAQVTRFNREVGSPKSFGDRLELTNDGVQCLAIECVDSFSIGKKSVRTMASTVLFSEST